MTQAEQLEKLREGVAKVKETTGAESFWVVIGTDCALTEADALTLEGVTAAVRHGEPWTAVHRAFSPGAPSAFFEAMGPHA